MKCPLCGSKDIKKKWKGSRDKKPKERDKTRMCGNCGNIRPKDEFKEKDDDED